MHSDDDRARQSWWWFSGLAFTIATLAAVLVLWSGPADVLDRGDKLSSILGGALAVGSLIVSMVTLRLALLASRTTSAGGGGARPRPRQLPPAARHFAGRREILTSLAALASNSADTLLIVAIDGTAGVGKTALAVHWAHQVAHRFPDGHLYVNLRGFDPTGSPMEPAEAVRNLLDAFGVESERIPATLDAQVGLYRSLVAYRPVLVVLDNARDEEQVRPLLPGSPHSLAVITSRNQLTGLIADGAHPVTLDVLAVAEARELLTSRVGSAWCASDPANVDEIIDWCARLPLALTLVAAHVAVRRDLLPTDVAVHIGPTRSSLNKFATPDTATRVRNVFDWSYRTLSDDVAGMFRLLGLSVGGDITVPAAASLAGRPAQDAELILAQLARAHLVEQRAVERFSLHDLLRAYAADLAKTFDSEIARRDAQHRLFDHYLHSAREASMLYPYRDEVAFPPVQSGVVVLQFRHHEHALAWLNAEYQNLLATIRRAIETGFDVHAWQLTWTLAPFCDRRGYWRDWIAIHDLALEAARRLGDPVAQAHIHRGLGRALTRLGRVEEALFQLRNALRYFEEVGDEVGQAYAHRSLGGLCFERGANCEALRHVERSLMLFQSAGHRAGEGSALANLGMLHVQAGDFQRGVEFCERAISALAGTNFNDAVAAAWDTLGDAYHHSGDYNRATTSYLRALDFSRAYGDRYYEAEIYIRIGNSHEARGDRRAAREAWGRAMAMCDELGQADGDRVRSKLKRLIVSRR